MLNQQSAFLVDVFERVLGVILARVSYSVTRVAVAYSGGLDSSALLHLANAYAATRGITLFAFHIHHGLSPNADTWARHCEQECARLGVRFDARRVTLAEYGRDGIEQAARVSRYAALGKQCQTFDIPLLLTAHHQDDQAETVLLQLLRGSGVAGLSGMELANTAPDLLGEVSLQLARPLLDVSRAELEQFIVDQDIPYVDDESNSDPRYSRNALRHKVMPSLDKCFPGYQRRFARTAQHMGAAQRLLNEIAAQDLSLCQDGDGIDILKLKQLNGDRIDNVLRYWLALRGVRMPSTAWLDEMRDQLLEAREDARVRVIHADGEIRRYRDTIFLTPRIDDAFRTLPALTFHWNGDEQIPFPAFGGTLYFDAADEGIDATWLAGQDLQIRFRSGGEKLKSASNRPTRSLKHHYQALKVPPWDRLKLPVISAGSQLLLAAGIGMNWGGVPIARGFAVRLRWERDTI